MKAEIANLLTFLRVIETGSFTKAAKSLGHPTSTISRRIARLEEDLGAKLLHRTTRRLSLTDPGRVYFERATHAVAALEDAEHELAESRGSPRGLVRVVAPSEHRMSSALTRDFLKEHPDVRVDLELTNRHVNLLEDGFDVGIHPGSLRDSTSLMASKLFDSHFKLVASPAYLKREGTPATPSQLSVHDCVVFSTLGAGATWMLKGERGESVQVPVRARLAVNHMEAAEEAARAGLGIALLPAVACDASIERGHLTAILPGLWPAPTPIWIVYPGGRHLAPAVRAYIDHVKAHFDF